MFLIALGSQYYFLNYKTLKANPQYYFLNYKTYKNKNKYFESLAMLICLCFINLAKNITPYLSCERNIFLQDKTRLILLTIEQVNRLKDEVLDQGIVTLFRKPGDRKHGRWVFQRTIFCKLEFRLPLYEKRRGCGWLLQIDVPESIIFAVVNIGQVTVFLETSNKTNAILFCNFLSLYEWKCVITLKVKPGRQSLENELSC